MSAYAPAHMAKAFGEAFDQGVAEFNAMTPAQRGAYYDARAEATERQIAALNDRNSFMEPELRAWAARMRESADYWRKGGKTLREAIA